MRKHQNESGAALDLATKMAVELAEIMAERSHWNKELLIGLANAVAANEKAQRRFRAAVLTRLATIEVRLADVQGCQLVEFWPPGRVSDEQREKLLQEVEERVSRKSNELGLRMVKFMYGGPEEPDARARGRRKWSGWEI